MAIECILAAMGRGEVESIDQSARRYTGAMLFLEGVRELVRLRRVVEAALGGGARG